MATYKAEALYQRYRGRLRPRSHYALGWLPRWARLATRAPRLANAPLKSKALTGAVKWMAGVDARRPVPVFADRSFRAWFARHRSPAGEPVMLWVDTFTNAYSPGVAQAAVMVLEDAGFRVEVPPEDACCGLTWLSTGQLDGARRELRRSLDALEPALDGGVLIVGVEPSCTALFRSDAVDLLPDDSRARAASRSVRTLGELLADREWVAPSLADLDAVVQPHCHQRAVMRFDADLALMEGAGATVRVVGGCCGMAGNFGVEAGHHDVSVQIAEHELLPALRAASAATIIADGFSCRTQVEHLAARRAVHLAEVLAAGVAHRRLRCG
jgi:Fe-S oxidoreductase